MSFSKPTAKNPSTRFMQWRGGFDGGGRLTWYDKSEETEKDVELPLSFVVLDELNTITGFSEKDQSSFWGNEVRNLQKDELVVRTKSGVVDRGLYAHIAERIKAKGAKYAKSVYIAFKDDTGEFVIGNIRFSGAALTAWIDLNKKFNTSECAVILTEAPKQGKKGATKYWIPVFETLALSDATTKVAMQLDQELQSFLDIYLNQQQDISTEVMAEDYEEDDDQEEADEDEQEVSVAKSAPKQEEKKDSINLKDVPF